MRPSRTRVAVVFLAVAFAGMVTGLPLAAAGEVAVPDGAATEDDAEPPAVAGIDLSGSVKIQTTSTYLYRGFLTEDRGAIVQATIAVNASIPVSESLGSIEAHAEFFNSFGDGPSGTGGPNERPSAWTERDLTLGATLASSSGVSLDFSYAWFRAPNASFEPLEEFVVVVAYDDSARWPAEDGLFRGFEPSLTLAIETLGQEDESGSPGTFLGVGISPSFATFEGERAPTISLPLSVGWSLGHYYEDADGRDHAFGYVDLGAELSVPFGDDGTWSLELGLHAVLLGVTPREFGGGDGARAVFTAGLSWSF